VVVAPAMHNNMYVNPITQENIAKLKSRGYRYSACSWSLASGAVGKGRLPKSLRSWNYPANTRRKGDLAGKALW